MIKKYNLIKTIITDVFVILTYLILEEKVVLEN